MSNHLPGFTCIDNNLLPYLQQDCFEVYALVPGLVREEVSSLTLHTLKIQSLCSCEIIILRLNLALGNNNTGPSPIRSGWAVGNKWRTREPYESLGSYSFQKGNARLILLLSANPQEQTILLACCVLTFLNLSWNADCKFADKNRSASHIGCRDPKRAVIRPCASRAIWLETFYILTKPWRSERERNEC